MKKHKITWRNGYAARETLIAFEAEYFPLMWVIDKAGKVRWNRDSSSPVSDTIEELLNE